MPNTRIHQRRAGVSTRLLALSILASLLALPFAALAMDLDKKIFFNIPAQDLSAALIEFSNQARLQVIVADDLTGQTTQGVSGEKAIKQALTQLLEPAGLSYRVAGETSITVGKASRSETHTTRADADTSYSAEASELSRVLLEEIVVTGTHIRGVAPTGSLLRIYTRQDIDRSGAGTMSQFARQMVENFASTDGLTSTSPNASYGGSSSFAANNIFQGSAFNLHGLGATSTLTLLNGQRMAPAGLDGSFADVSQIPLEAVDHIEVLSDGASAIYGADAQAGVVNIVTRKDFTGAQTQLRYGYATRGGAIERSGSQLLGHAWDSGNAFIGYEHYDQGGLDASQRSYIADFSGPNSLLAQNRRNSVLAGGHQQLGEKTGLSGHALYSDRDFDTAAFTENSLFTQSNVSSGNVRQLSLSLGLERELSGSWHAQLTGNHSETRQSSDSASEQVAGGSAFQFSSIVEGDTRVSGGELLLQGTLWALPGGSVKLAVGGGAHVEKFSSVQRTFIPGFEFDGGSVPELDRHVSSAFAELLVPLVGSENARSGARRIELSIAGRYDDYDDFGSTANPKIGLLWQPIEGLAFRSTYGTSFRAPKLSDLGFPPQINVSPIADSDSATGFTNTILVQGGNPDLGPEESTSFTAGFEFSPPALSGFSASLSYFQIELTDRVTSPPVPGGLVNLDLGNADLVEQFIVRDPALQTVQDYFDDPAFIGDFSGEGPQGVGAIFFGRVTNISEVEESGLNLTARYGVPFSAGKLEWTLGVEHLLSNDLKIVPAAPSVSLLNSYAEPPKWRGRGGVAWTRERLTAALSISHVNGYDNTLFAPSQPIDSWTTADVFLGYSTGDDNAAPILRNLRFRLNVNNLTDERPPTALLPETVLLPGGRGLPYDPVNASAVGRLVSIQVSKGW